MGVEHSAAHRTERTVTAAIMKRAVRPSLIGALVFKYSPWIMNKHLIDLLLTDSGLEQSGQNVLN